VLIASSVLLLDSWTGHCPNIYWKK